MTKTLSRLALACLFLFADGIEAQDATPNKTLTLFTTGGFISAIQSIAPIYEKATGFSLIIKESPSTGHTPMAITNRLALGESADVVIMEDWELRKLIDQGQLQKKSRIDLGKSFIAMAVRKGAKKHLMWKGASRYQKLTSSCSSIREFFLAHLWSVKLGDVKLVLW